MISIALTEAGGGGLSALSAAQRLVGVQDLTPCLYLGG